jgi:acyl-CoA thioester hydrolase
MSRPGNSLIAVRFAETDAMRFVYYANHFVYYEVARTDWLAGNGLPYAQLEEEGCAIPVLQAHCDYRKPARYGDVLWIEATPSVVDRVRLRFDYATRRQGPEGELLATGHTVHACMDREGRPRRIPAHLLAMLSD